MHEKRPKRPKRTSPSGASRANEIVASLRAGAPSSTEIFEAFYQLDALPPDEVREALAPWVPSILDAAPLVRPLRLRTLSVVKDADVLDLGPIAEEQLRIAGKSWDGADLAPEERLDGELEDSFAGTLERRVLADEESPETPLFDVLLFLEDSGVVFAAGTTKVVALIAYRKVETRDRRTRDALEEAIAAPAAAPKEPTKKPAKKKPAAKTKTATKTKAASKKATTKKSPARRGA